MKRSKLFWYTPPSLCSLDNIKPDPCVVLFRNPPRTSSLTRQVGSVSIRRLKMRSMTTYLLLSLLAACVSSQDSWRFVGEFTNFQHNIKGSLYINGSHELVIKNFDYDGQGPSGDNNIFFYAVNSSYPYSPEDVERGYRNSRGFKLLLPFPSDGKVYQYEDDIPDLRSHFQVLMKEQGVDRKSGES